MELILKETEEVIGPVGSTYYEDVDKVGICYFIGTPIRKEELYRFNVIRGHEGQ